MILKLVHEVQECFLQRFLTAKFKIIKANKLFVKSDGKKKTLLSPTLFRPKSPPKKQNCLERCRKQWPKPWEQKIHENMFENEKRGGGGRCLFCRSFLPFFLMIKQQFFVFNETTREIAVEDIDQGPEIAHRRQRDEKQDRQLHVRVQFGGVIGQLRPRQTLLVPFHGLRREDSLLGLVTLRRGNLLAHQLLKKGNWKNEKFFSEEKKPEKITLKNDAIKKLTRNDSGTRRYRDWGRAPWRGNWFSGASSFSAPFCLPICRELVLMWCEIVRGKIYSVSLLSRQMGFSRRVRRKWFTTFRKSQLHEPRTREISIHRGRKTCVDGVVRVRSETRRAMLRGLKFSQQSRLCTPQWRSTSTASLLPLSIELRLVEFRIIWRCEETRKCGESVRKKWREEICRLQFLLKKTEGKYQLNRRC